MEKRLAFSKDPLTYIREVLNDSFCFFIKLGIIATALLGMMSWLYEDISGFLLCAAIIPILFVCWYVTYKGYIHGILLVILIAALGSAYNINPTAAYTGPTVSIFLIVAPLLATRFIEPVAGVWALFLQLFLVTFSLIIKDIDTAVSVRYIFFAGIDLSIITGMLIISSNLLRTALIRMYEDELELKSIYDDILAGWSTALELRHKETKGHTDRVTQLTLAIATAIGIPDHELPDIRRGALLHDIGKTGIPDEILLKQGPLTPIERDIMKLHPIYAYQWLRPFQRLGKVLDIPYCHHEKWDGTGYPRGLRGRDIPISARIFSIADVYDAVRSRRPYREPMSREEALNLIEERSGRDFDPALVRAFLKEEERLYNQIDDYNITKSN
jgi:putative nucleotidyltransferase with HDIG domain